MRLQSIGLSHNTAQISLREKLSLTDDGIRAALSWQLSEDQFTGLTELIVLSTCNRIELYATSREPNLAQLEQFLSHACNLPEEQFKAHLYRFDDLDAARHLFEVSAGLDSLVLGEPQILGQVVDALELARGQNTTGPVLNRLFQAAIHAGKRTRAETAIAHNPASVSSLTASLAERVIHPLAEAQIVIVGAGEMAELAVEALRKRGANNIMVVNRNLARANELAQRWNAQATTFENLHTALAGADIVISSTGASHFVLTAEMVRKAMEQRRERALVLIDIAVPRDIDPDVVQIEQVRLYDIDNLNHQLEHSLADRMAAVPHVKNILEEELVKFTEFMNSLDMIPIIADIHQRAELVRKAELEKTFRHLPELNDSERMHVDALTKALVKKLLASPTNRLRIEAASPQATQLASAARTLFGLNAINTSSEGIQGTPHSISGAADQ